MTRAKAGDTACSQWNLYWLPNKDYQIKKITETKTTQGDPPHGGPSPELLSQTNIHSFILKGSTILQ